MTKVNKDTQIKAVEKVLTLRKNGVTLTGAKTIVAGEFDISVWKLNQFMKIHGPKTTTNDITRTNRTTPLQVTEYSFNEMSNDVRGVLKSIIKQDGRYTTREAGVVGKLYGAELTKAKLVLEVHKHNTKVSSSTANDNTLVIR